MALNIMKYSECNLNIISKSLQKYKLNNVL
jgi:hypothetical protein